MMDQYKEQYKKETEQIHAPADLIARTKAAVREEEARIQRERAASAGLAQQAAESAAQEGKYSAQAAPVTPKKRSWGAAARKWAYPLSAVAAIVVLASVSLMMRGSGKWSSESPAYEMAADAGSGGEESAAAGAAEEAFDEAFPAEAAMETEGAEADRETGVAADVTEMESASADAGAASQENFASDKGANFVDDTAGALPETERTLESADSAETPAAVDSEAREIENTTTQKREMKETFADKAASDVWVEKVWKKPAFVNRADTEKQIYEDTVFYVAEEENGWAAYVEGENGGGYVIRGEAESREAFLEEGYRRLEEMSW